MLAYFLNCFAHECLVPLVRALWLEFHDKHSLWRLFGLSEILIEGRTLLSVCQQMGSQFRISVLSYHQSVYVVIMIDYDFPVGCKVDVAFTTPKGILLCKRKTCNTVLAVYSLFAFPKPSMGSNGYLTIVTGFGKRGREHGKSRADC